MGTHSHHVTHVGITGVGRVNHNAKPPRPCKCERCFKPIGEDDPVIYDRLYPFLVELEKADGDKYFAQKIGGFCSEFCMHHRRQSLFAPARERSMGKPSP